MLGTWHGNQCLLIALQSRAGLSSLLAGGTFYILLILESKGPLIVIEMFDTASLKCFTTKLYLCLSQALRTGTGSEC